MISGTERFDLGTGGSWRKSDDAPWTRRSLTGGARLDELVARYQSLGLEVRLEPVTSETTFESEEERRECEACLGSDPSLRVIYTRPITQPQEWPGAEER